HAEALLLILEKGDIGETYNVGGRNERRNIDLVHTICKLMDELSPKKESHENLISFVTDRPGHDKRYAIDASKIERTLGWRPAVTLDEGLRQTVQWYLENDWWRRAIREKGFAGARLGLSDAAGTKDSGARP
ncbi:MAG: GDP-mannose 4,6-dehydratase, partial [Pseudomonadota bacterium]